MPTAKPATVKVVRKARTGRKTAAATTAAHNALDTLWNAKDRQTVEVVDEKGKVLDTYPAVIVKPATVGKPATYTGMVGLIRGWAKRNGYSVRVSEVAPSEFAIRNLA